MLTAPRDPLAKLLGFDPDSGAPVVERVEVREVERVVDRVITEPASETSFEGRLRDDPRGVLLAALGVIFERNRDAKPHGPLGACRDAVFWALNEIAHVNRGRLGDGWIIGKRDNPQT